jgi:hypothetical protein
MPLTQAITQFRQQLDALPQCVILAAPKMPPENDLKRAVRNILEGGDDPVYSDGIESIDRAEIVDEAIEGEFSDRIGVRSIKRVGFRITPKSIQTWLLNPDEVAKFSLYQADVLALFAPINSATSTPLSTSQGKPMFGKGSRAGKTKKCSKGLICGGSCIARTKKCSKTPSPEIKAKIEEAIAGKEVLAGSTFDRLSAEKQAFLMQKLEEAKTRAANFPSSTGIKKVFPAAPAVLHSVIEIKEFEEAIETGAHRILKWDTPNGQAIAKIGISDTRELIYKLNNGSSHPYKTVIDGLKPHWDKVEKATPLKSEDYIYV